MRSRPWEVRPLPCRPTSLTPKQTRVFIEKVLADFGRIDILVNNAGITRDKTFKKMSFEEWHKVIDTNLSSAFNTCKVALASHA